MADRESLFARASKKALENIAANKKAGFLQIGENVSIFPEDEMTYYMGRAKESGNKVLRTVESPEYLDKIKEAFNNGDTVKDLYATDSSGKLLQIKNLEDLDKYSTKGYSLGILFDPSGAETTPTTRQSTYPDSAYFTAEEGENWQRRGFIPVNPGASYGTYVPAGVGYFKNKGAGREWTPIKDTETLKKLWSEGVQVMINTEDANYKRENQRRQDLQAQNTGTAASRTNTEADARGAWEDKVIPAINYLRKSNKDAIKGFNPLDYKDITFVDINGQWKHISSVEDLIAAQVLSKYNNYLVKGLKSEPVTSYNGSNIGKIPEEIKLPAELEDLWKEYEKIYSTRYKEAEKQVESNHEKGWKDTRPVQHTAETMIELQNEAPEEPKDWTEVVVDNWKKRK